jgi:hypothetical protein
MKYLFYSLLITCVLQACKAKTSHKAIDTMPAQQQAYNNVSLIEKFKPILQGVWVRSNYLADVIRTRSPYASFSKLKGYASLTIEMDSIKNDKLEIGVSLNNHEGYSFDLLFKPGHTPTVLKIQQHDYAPTNDIFELGYIVKSQDTSLVLYHYKDKSYHLIDSTTYTRVTKKSAINDTGYGINFFVNQKLITGNYSSTDSAGNTSPVKFKTDGTVYGLANFKTYSVGTDFEAGPENNLDIIYFDDIEQNTLAYKINRDTITLYSTRENSDHSLLDLGKVRYKLIKLK